MKLADAYVEVSARGMGRVNQQFGMLKSSVARYMGIAGIAGIVGKSVKSFASFEKEMAQVNTLIRLGDRDFKKMSKDVLDLAWNLGTSPGGLAKALYQITSAGFKSADAMNLLEASFVAGVAGASDIITMADVLTTILNSYGASAKEATKYSDLLFKTIEFGKTTAGELGQSYHYVAKMAALTGIEFEELSAMVGALTRNGIKTQQVMTGLRAVLMQLLKPQKASLELAEKLGITFDLVAIKAMGFHKWLFLLQKQTGGNAKLLAELFGRAQSVGTILTLAGEGATTFMEALAKMKEATGATGEAMDIMDKTVSRKWEKFKSKLETMGIELGGALATALMPSEWFGKPTSEAAGYGAALDRIKKQKAELRKQIAGGGGLPPAFFWGADAKDVERAYESTQAKVNKYRQLSGAERAYEKLIADEEARRTRASHLEGLKGYRFEKGPIEKWWPGGETTFPMGFWVEVDRKLGQIEVATEATVKKLGLVPGSNN